MQYEQVFSRPADQDKKHFELGCSPAIPGRNYFADVVGLPDEQSIHAAVAGLTNEQEIENALVKLFERHQLPHRLARDFMKWRLRIERNTRGPKGEVNNTTAETPATRS